MSEASAPTLTPAVLAELAAVAEDVGLLRLGAAALDDPGFARAARAFDEFVAEGRHGTMTFLARGRRARHDPDLVLPGARSVLVAVAPHGGEPGRIARYAQFFDYHTDLHRRMAQVVARLEARLPAVRTRVCVDTKPVMERAAAHIAGVGQLGKNGCLIVPGLGSFVMIATALTTATWRAPTTATTRPPALDPGVCGSCTRCLEACPTGAFAGPGRLDARRCIAYLTIERRGPIEDALADGIGDRVAGCDVCQEVCPHNASEHRGARAPSQAWLRPPPGPPRTPDLVALATLGSSRHRAFVRATPLTRIPRAALRRNALVALGNRAGPLGASERAAIEGCLRDADPAVRQAAARALRRRTGPAAAGAPACERPCTPRRHEG